MQVHELALIYKTQQQERERISADIHDELGSGIMSIRILSEIATKKMNGHVLPELKKISCSAADLLNKMHAIIWSMNNGNDSLANLVAYTREWIIEYFENCNIDYNIILPVTIPESEITGDKRRNIFLCVKESLNNILKHANATRVQVSITCEQLLRIIIQDNGRGIDFKQKRPFGNGLHNIRRRMESIGGAFRIFAQQGTITVLELPINIDNSIALDSGCNE